MLKLLLDEHISPDVAQGIHRRYKTIPVSCLAEWESGLFMGVADDILLAEAAAQKVTLVTYDRRTIPPLLKAWAEAGLDHGGIIFVDEKTIPPSDIGGLIQSLHALFNDAAKWDWQNRVCFLRR